MGEATACYYRKEPWMLWPKHQTYAPARPKPLTTKKEIRVFVAKTKPKKSYRLLSNNTGEVKSFLPKRISGFPQIIKTIQVEISNSNPGQDVYILVGVGHNINGHNNAYNRILKALTGLTHSVLEWNKVNCEGKDKQREMDNFLTTGKNRPKRTSDTVPKKELRAINSVYQIAYDKCLNAVLADPSCKSQKKVKRLGNSYSLSMREIYQVQSVLQRLFKGRRNVILWKCGASHVEKRRLPAVIKYFYRNARIKPKVLSIVVNGGDHHSSSKFDRVIEEANLRNSEFILDLRKNSQVESEFVDADLVLHLPTGNRVRYFDLKEGVLQTLIAPAGIK